MATAVAESRSDMFRFVDTVLERSTRRAAARTPPEPPGVLLVSSEPMTRTLLSRTLRQYGLTVWVAADGHQALELCDREPDRIQALLFDLDRGEREDSLLCSGHDEAWPSGPLCFLIRGADEQVEEQLPSTRVARVFRKPFLSDDIAQTLWELLESPSARSRDSPTAASSGGAGRVHARDGPARLGLRGRIGHRWVL
jgi:CheY-like chemotaxis protein